MAIRVLVVDDSPVALTILQRILSSTGEIEVVGVARTGIEGLEMIPKLKPDVICTDLHMPKMNGLEFTIETMAMYPTPILVISASVQEDDTHHVFRLLDAGAVDIFPKPRSGQTSDYELIKQPLINKIKVLAGIKVFRKKRQEPLPTPSQSFTPTSPLKPTGKIKIVAIGASTGGPQALVEIFTRLPFNFPVPIVCVQHISEGFLGGLVEWLNNNSRLPVKIAFSGEIPQPGVIYFPPERKHLEFEIQRRFLCSGTLPVCGHCPSVSVMFKSVAKVFGSEGMGILLTGMGRDGADGLLSLYQQGGYTIAQDEKTSVVFGMPNEAIKLGGAKKVLPVGDIANHIMTVVHQG
jgi:two-component system chemotaxis response regulator CheB